MNVITATTEYERWLSQFCSIHVPDLEYKHARMADVADPFPFFRASYYRWVTLWSEACPDEAFAPRVLGIGDLHLENYGSWRDSDGRLCWGVNDFDEVDEIPYTNDLVRLAASVRVAKMVGYLDVKFAWACRAILTGYRDAIEARGMPFVLEERHPELRALAMAKDRDPTHFWAKLTDVLSDAPANVPEGATAALIQDLPDPKLAIEVRFRPRVGMGSLGKPRYVALANWSGGWIARECKAVTPPASSWAAGADPSPSRIGDALHHAVRCHDPYYRPGAAWITRRLAPRSCRIELGQIASFEDVLRLLWAMGGEAANVHLGSRQVADALLRDLDSRPDGWLASAARAASKAVLRDWQEWTSAS